MCKEITKLETRLALSLLSVINESDEKVRKNVVIDYVLNALGIKEEEVEENPYKLNCVGSQQVRAYINDSEQLHGNAENVAIKRAVRAFEKDEIEKVEMTMQEAIMQAEDLLDNLENEEVTEIDINDIRAIRKLSKEKKETKKPLKPIKLKINTNREKVEDKLKKLIDVGLINEGDYRNLEIEIE